MITRLSFLKRRPSGQQGTPVCCRGPVGQDMLEILMNGVFAFAMTLIVKNNIPLPTAEDAANVREIVEYLVRVCFDGFHFMFTFIILAVFYVLAFEIMRNIRLVDREFVYLEFLFLLAIVFVPLTSLLMSITDLVFPYALAFHVNIILCGTVLAIQWWHATDHRRLTIPEVSRIFAKDLYIRMLIFPATAVIGIFLDTGNLSQGNFLYIFPVIAFVWLSRGK